MSIAMLVDNPAGSRELYERILESLDRDLPLGGVLHLAGPSPTGGWRVIEIWDSPEEAKKFLVESFGPALRAAGFEGPPPTPQLWPVQVVEAASATYDPSTVSSAEGGAR